MKRPAIRTLDLAGTPAEIGTAHGIAYAQEICAYTEDRIKIATAGVWSGGSMTRTDIFDLAESMIPAHADFDADLHEEMAAMAKAADISMAEAIIVGGFTDFVDVIRAVTHDDNDDDNDDDDDNNIDNVSTDDIYSEDDCTAAIIPDALTEDGGMLAQTWDMHDSATGHVIMLRLTPNNAPSARVFSTTGCLGQIGMNDEGVCVGINNLTTNDARLGVTWPSVVRAMLKTSTAKEALDILLGANLAGAHNYLIFDRHGDGYNVEAMPTTRPVTPLKKQPLIHTNHTLDASSSQVEASRPAELDESSRSRLARASEILTAKNQFDTQAMINMLRDDQICQKTPNPAHIESSGAVIMRPRTHEMWACWGLPTHNDFHLIESLASASQAA